MDKNIREMHLQACVDGKWKLQLVKSQSLPYTKQNQANEKAVLHISINGMCGKCLEYPANDVHIEIISLFLQISHIII